MKIREAKATDRQSVLDFCTSTFSWGDYIDEVWDLWYGQPKSQGLLLVAAAESEDNIGDGRESDGAVALAHASYMPAEKNVWLEGIRVHPDYRRRDIATNLVKRVLDYGRSQNACRVIAIVAKDNVASQKMLARIGFTIASRWIYCSKTTTNNNDMDKSKNQLSADNAAAQSEMMATSKPVLVGKKKDVEKIWDYLEKSKIYKLSAKRYVSAWQWKLLDKKALAALVSDDRVIMAGNPIDGIAIINKSGYWKRTGVLQVVYLDSCPKASLQSLMSFVTCMYAEGKFSRLHVICHQSKNMVSVIRSLGIEESEQFLLYEKKIA